MWKGSSRVSSTSLAVHKNIIFVWGVLYKLKTNFVEVICVMSFCNLHFINARIREQVSSSPGVGGQPTCISSHVREYFSWLWTGKSSSPYRLPPTGHRPHNYGQLDADYVGWSQELPGNNIRHLYYHLWQIRRKYLMHLPVFLLWFVYIMPPSWSNFTGTLA
jgi:hypothetical protein